MSEREHQIRERAYLLWQRAGQPHGHGDDFWHLAAVEIAGEATSRSPNGVGITELGPIDTPPEPAATLEAKSKSKVNAKSGKAAKGAKGKGEPATIETAPPEPKADKPVGKKKKKRKD